MPKIVYLCEHCGKQYPTAPKARACEIIHEAENVELQSYFQIASTLIEEGVLPCLYCERHYFVYDNELNCDCCKHCRNFDMFIPQKDVAKDN